MLPIDVHILTMPSDRADWSAALRADLDAEGVHQHWLPGIAGEHAAARAAGFKQGSAEFVSTACPDDRILPGTYAKLLAVLRDNPLAPFAWAGEQDTEEDTAHFIGPPRIWAEGYSARLHRGSPMHVHGVILYRRRLVEQALPIMERARGAAGFGSDWLLALLLADPTNPLLPAEQQPVHLPIVARLWRHHDSQAHKLLTHEGFQEIRRLAGIPLQYLSVIRHRAPSKAKSTAAPPSIRTRRCGACGG